ncbi:MAG: DEAD/DEAH box helicase [Luteolibacter sp.]
MSDWTEETLRKAATWQAFKEGKSLFETGAVMEAKAGSTGWQGMVKYGRRPVRVSVVVKSATNLETRCPCPDNQRTGAVCAHAVAVGLATLAKPQAGVIPEREKMKLPPKVERKADPAVALEVLFPPNWRESLTRGKLAVTLNRVPENEGERSALQTWLERQGVDLKPTFHLHLDGERLSGFLEALIDAPRVWIGKERVALTISSGARIPLKTASRAGEEIRLQAEGELWTELGESFWQAHAQALIRLGAGKAPEAIFKTIQKVSSGCLSLIPEERFFSRIDIWQEWFHFPEGGWLDSLHFVPARTEIQLSLEGSLQHLDATLRIKYDNAEPVPPGLGKVDGFPRLVGDRCEIRDLTAEEAAVKQLENAGFQLADISSGRFVLKGESSVIGFLTRSLPALRREWKVKESDRFKQDSKQVVSVEPRIEILGSGEDWLSFDLKFQAVDGSLLPMAEVRALLREGRGKNPLVGGKRLIVSDDVANLIDPLFSEMEMRQEGGHFMATARAGELVREIRNKISNSHKKSETTNLFTFDSPATLQATLRPYQTHGAGWLWDRVSRFGGALLADDMGLGKTLQTIALVERLMAGESDDSNKVLIVATASLLGNWKAEFSKFAPGRMVRVLHGTNREKEQQKSGAGEVLLTSYGTLGRDLAWHLKQSYQAVIVDEASFMRNPDTDHAKAIAKLNARHRVALTGTPVENGVKDLWSIFRFIQPGWLGSREDFKERYELPLATGEDARAVMERLRLKTAPFLLRRTKEQVAPDLPTKLFIDELCDLSSEQQSVYRDVLAEGRKRVEAIEDSGQKGAARMQMLTALLRLRQTCCDLALLGNDRFNQLAIPKRSGKMERLLELIEEAVAGNHRMLVFSQFQTQLKEIEKCIAGRGWESLRLDGQTRNRQELVDRFQKPDGPPIFLISLKAGGYGLNLTAADTVVHFDPWWNPAAEAQATDRAHRIGQTRPVTVYRLLTRGTVEEKVVRLQAKKRELATAIDESGAGDAAGWSMEELKEVIGAG